MGKQNIPIYGIENLYLFTRYQTREAYAAATGEEPPAWDPTKQPKHWFDPAARTSTKRTFVYERALVYSDTTGAVLPDDNGKPLVDSLSILRTVAATVNIPPNASNVEGADVPEIPVPLRALEEGEELFFQIGGVAAVKNTTLYAALKEGFTQSDRALLQAIGAKLGA